MYNEIVYIMPTSYSYAYLTCHLWKMYKILSLCCCCRTKVENKMNSLEWWKGWNSSENSVYSKDETYYSTWQYQSKPTIFQNKFIYLSIGAFINSSLYLILLKMVFWGFSSQRNIFAASKHNKHSQNFVHIAFALSSL